MVEEAQLAQNEAATVAEPQSAAPAAASYKVVPFNDVRQQHGDLYAFREAMAEKHAQESQKKEEPKKQPLPLALILGGMAVVGLLAVAIALLFFGGFGFSFSKPSIGKPPVAYIDLGTQRFDQADLGGRLIARWSGSGSYQLFIDPLDEDHMDGFQAVVQDPPHTLTFNISLLDAGGEVLCQKEILIPPMNGTGPNPDPALELQPRQSSSGDTVQNMADRGGQVTEIVASGSLPCSIDAYNRIASWNFSSNFPARDDQVAWLKHQDMSHKKIAPKGSSSPYGIYSLVRSLPASIEGDDVIVSDNPGKGIVATSQGRIFLVGTDVLTNRALDWQSFPASVHFRCEKTASCVVTRLNSRTAVRARLLR